MANHIALGRVKFVLGSVNMHIISAHQWQCEGQAGVKSTGNSIWLFNWILLTVNTTNKKMKIEVLTWQKWKDYNSICGHAMPPLYFPPIILSKESIAAQNGCDPDTEWNVFVINDIILS